MKGLLNISSQVKHQFKSYYCAGCKQRKPCQLLTGWNSVWKSYCCACYFQNQQEQAADYNSYEEVLANKQIEREKRLRQLQLLKSYEGCKECGSLEVDGRNLLEETRLVCQPCLAKREGWTSSPISFCEQQKWFKKFWKIEIVEWLENYGCLPVNANCARKWIKDKGHLPNKCDCLEVEAQETYELFANSLREMGEKIKGCQCEVSNKPRTPYYDGDNYGYTYCEKCEERIAGAGKHGVIKNRNNPSFWGLNIRERVLCRKCLGNLVERMPRRKKYLFWEYGKRGCWG